VWKAAKSSAVQRAHGRNGPLDLLDQLHGGPIREQTVERQRHASEDVSITGTGKATAHVGNRFRSDRHIAVICSKHDQVLAVGTVC
jgi:hypothetical protein